MPDLQSFREQAIQQQLYEFQEGGDVERMLEMGPVNSRVNTEMAWWCLAVAGVASNWTGKYRNLFGCIENDLQRMMLVLDGYSRMQALEMRGRQTIAEYQASQEKAKGGLLGLFSGNK